MQNERTSASRSGASLAPCQGYDVVWTEDGEQVKSSFYGSATAEDFARRCRSVWGRQDAHIVAKGHDEQPLVEIEP